MPKGVYPRTAEHRAKISAASMGRRAHLGFHHSAEARAKISAANRGKPSPNRGKKTSLAVRLKISMALRGPNNPQWRGGIENGAYAWTFNSDLRTQIRQRDGYRCCLCGVPQQECNGLLHIHHIDYDKQNSDPVNLISLCNSCHMRTNHNREHWKGAFGLLMIQKSLA
jgi:hypothetical protein